MDISIIIVSWNVSAQVADCLNSIKRFSPAKARYEVIVVDNASTDDTAELIRQHHPWVHLIVNDANYGFAKANNIGINVASGEYLLLLNPDTLLVDSDGLDKLLDFARSDASMGVCGPQLLNRDLTVQQSVRKFPSFGSALYRYTLLKYFGLGRKSHRAYMMVDCDLGSTREVDQIMGAAFLVRKSVALDAGLFDERYFMYYEEVDFCYRVKQMGYRNVFYPDAKIIHLGGASSSQIPAKSKLMALSSMLKYFRKNHSGMLTNLFIITLKFLFLIKAYIDPMRDSLKFLASSSTKRPNRKAALLSDIDILKECHLKLIRF